MLSLLSVLFSTEENLGMALTHVLVCALMVSILKAQKPHTHGFRTEIEALRFLFSDKWTKYDAPFSDNGTVTVNHLLTLNRIISLSLEEQVLTMDAWIQVQYNDPDMAWNPAMFGDLKTVRVPSNKLWKPDILLYNNAGMTDGHTAEVLAVLTYDGTIFYVQPVQLKSYCKTPRNLQVGARVTCSLKFGSWAYDGLSLDLKVGGDLEEIDLSNYDADFNRKWKVTSATVTRNVVSYACCPEPYVDLLYSLVIERKI